MKIDVYYTGGGIWLSEVGLPNNKIAVVSNDFPEVLSVYKKPIDDIWYLHEDMIFSLSENKLDQYHKNIYNQLLNQLNKTTPQK